MDRNLTNPTHRHVTPGRQEPTDVEARVDPRFEASTVQDEDGDIISVDGRNRVSYTIAHYCWVDGCEERSNHRIASKHADVTLTIDGEERQLDLCREHRKVLEQAPPA